jgi:D-serine ammonia-lyase
LYSFPLHASSIPRLAKLSAALGPGAVSVMIDHIDQMPYLEALSGKSGVSPLVFLKIDMGYGRAGVLLGTEALSILVDALLLAEKRHTATFHGLYCHAGNSYDARKGGDALTGLQTEWACLEGVADEVRIRSPQHELTLSVGATPTATSLQDPTILNPNPAPDQNGSLNPELLAQATAMKEHLSLLKTKGYNLEVHAGVYPTLDLQQLATHARSQHLLSSSDIAITILAEVASLYPGRGTGGTTEALITAGSLALGREPCKDLGDPKGRHYTGWGILMPWNDVANPAPTADFPAVHTGWQVGRISQEHGILVWQGKKECEVPLKIGQKVRVWPNHACIAGAGYESYLIVDSRRTGNEDEVVDVWQRWRGW